MSDINRLLEARKKIKARKPKYLRQDAQRVKKLEKNWRRPKGRHSKMRQKFKGHRRSPEIGYGSPRKVKHMIKEGLMPVLIRSEGDLENLESNAALIISGKLGLKKKLDVLKKARIKGLKVENYDVDKFIESAEKKLKENKKVEKKEATGIKVAEKKDNIEDEKIIKKKVLEGKNAGEFK